MDNEKDTISVIISKKQATELKRGILSILKNVYDPLELVTPLTLEGKSMYHKVCGANRTWDTQLPREYLHMWRTWENRLPK